jgi:cation diffusion facilitator family transporter
MDLSLGASLLMLVGKTAAWWLTGSVAILSDAAESVIHVAAVAFAAFSLHLSHRPANHRYRYGFERISFFSAGFEGALIMIAAVTIIAAAVEKWRRGLEIEHLSAGLALTLAASLINVILGLYLIRTGRQTQSLILEANGQHVLTDSWTSFGVVLGLALVLFTGWKPFDPLCAIAVALNILWTGAGLIARAVRGLMDYADPAIEQEIRAILDETGVVYHAVRFRDSGHKLFIEFHLLLPGATPLGEAHREATRIERRLVERMRRPVEVTTHLESLEDHQQMHPGEGAPFA